MLIAVLLAMLFISSIAIALTLTTRGRLQTTANFASTEEARLLADGLAELVAADWAAPQHPAAQRLSLAYDGRVVRCRIDEKAVGISVTSVLGLVDLNAAPQGVLERLLEAVNIPSGRAQVLAAAITDFRDGDNDPAPGGAETNAYLAAGLPHGPKNAPFETVGELEQVLGMTREIFNAVRRYVTVNSRSPFIDRAVAAPELVAGLARLEISQGPPRIEIFQHAADSSRIVRVMVSVETSRGVRFVREAVVERATQTKNGYALVDWTSHRDEAELSGRSIPLDCF